MHLSPAASHTDLPGPLQKAVISTAATVPRLQYVLAQLLLPYPKKLTKPRPSCDPNYDRQTPDQSPW